MYLCTHVSDKIIQRDRLDFSLLYHANCVCYAGTLTNGPRKCKPYGV